MFGNLSMGEITILAVIALVVLGPEKFPEYAKIAMRAFRDFRGYIDDIKREMANELKPVQEEIRELARHNPEEYIEDLSKAISSLDDEKNAGGSTPNTETASNAAPETDPGPKEADSTEQAEEGRTESPERLDG
ncbi:MAG TPA: twin-arginine translocase TatA/TatE family subunit [Candidatus Hydrogenedentes bacterium]|nr:twin-arginine translocase TatA/TatE family subunit [Candidatus Hydrogenedentota bacterium]HOV75788.1 twin-arginine translocase TatA/TatE family subunit [Candidatus Hydrogenedentota bacterium]HPC17363.1 twin-arginine translocase TatA/TatE family subunit [Candidatus Hydrogenedentota bacterium]HRT20097.1 twin-arginine translocase TatA/TatE family subunit [Candidatus Hydrogenedentota bacterium]HRT64839.1 twin-arginine translocase TatA/TatE family subunit [Candidatus Hydrogenedentota bacterium]